MKKECSSLGGLEPPTFRLTAERANRLRHRDNTPIIIVALYFYIFFYHLSILTTSTNDKNERKEKATYKANGQCGPGIYGGAHEREREELVKQVDRRDGL